MSRENVILSVTSVLSVLLFTFHMAGDIMRGIEKGNFSNLGFFPIGVVWLYAALLLVERRSGYLILLLASILGSGIPLVHMMGKGLGTASIVKSDGAFFFIWTLMALGITALISVILSARGLWSVRRAARK